MLPFHVVVKPYLRPDLAAAHPHPNSFSITLIQPLSFLTFTHSSAQRTTPIYFSFNHLHTLSTATEGVGGTPSPNLPTFPRVFELSPLFSYPWALFCIFLHSQRTQPPCFQLSPHSGSKKKHRGWGTPLSSARPFRGDCHAPNQSPVTSHLFGHPSHCSQTRLVPQLATALETSRSGETTPLPPVSNNTERTSGTVRRRSRLHPDSVGVASRAWVHRSNVGP